MVDTSTKTILLSLATTFALALVIVVASNIASKIHPPADQLLSNHRSRREDGCLFHQFRKLVGVITHLGGIFLASFWNKDHVTLKISSGFVVLAVRDLP